MIIEVIPFFHIMAADIVRMLGEENTHQIIATVMVAFALSSILTGVFPPRFFLSCYPFLGQFSNILRLAGHRYCFHRVWSP